MRKPDFCICQNKDADQLRGTAKLISAFVFAIQIIQSLYCLYPKFQASSHLMWLWPKAEGNSASGHPQHRGGDSFDCWTERYEIVVLLPNSEDTCYWKYFLEFE